MRILSSVILVFFLQNICFSQISDLNVFSSGGGNLYGVSMQQSFTIGEPVTESFSGQAMMLTQGYQQSDLMRELNGQVTYDNLIHSILDNTNVLLKIGTQISLQTTSNYAGYYMFKSVRNGSYQLTGQSTKPWGGCNSSDALLIMKHFTGITTLTGIRLIAADANASGTVNSIDALQVSRRFVGLQSSFAIGDWVFEKHNVNVNGFANLTDNFKGLCTGDVNGSYDPNNVKTEPKVELAEAGVIKVNGNEEVTVPVFVGEDISLSALSLVLKYPAENITLKSVTAISEPLNLVYNIINGELRISWYTLSPLRLQAGETLLQIGILGNSGHWENNESCHFEIGYESELADFSGSPILGKSLKIPVLIRDEAGFYLGQNLPNPGAALTTIPFCLPEPGQVKLVLSNILGEETAVFIDQQYEAGNHTFRFDCTHIPAGTYLYTMHYVTSGQSYTGSKRMVIVH